MCLDIKPDIDLTEYYNKLADLLNKNGMYAENSGGLQLNYSHDIELGLNPQLLSVFKKKTMCKLRQLLMRTNKVMLVQIFLELANMLV